MALTAQDRPTWIKDELFKEVLEESTDCEVQIYDLKVERAVAKGENYQSDLYRVILKYTQGGQMGFR